MQKRKLGMLVCSLILVLTMLSACGSGSSTATPAPTSGETAVATTAAPTEGPVDPFGKMKEPVKLTGMRILCSWMAFDEGESVNDNWWTRTWKDQLNVEVEFTHIADNWGEPLDSKIAVAIATDDLPDFLYTYSSNASKIAKAGMITDLSATYEKFASPYIKKNMSTFDGAPYKASFYNGKMFGIPSNGVYNKGTSFAWIRKDWLDKLGLPVPKTFEEIEATARAFRDNAAKLGVKGLVPIEMHKYFTGNGGCDTGRNVIEIFGGLEGGWVEKDGKLVQANTQPWIIPGLTKLAEWYKEGLLAKDFYLKDPGVEGKEDMTSGKIGITFGEQNTPNSDNVRNLLINNHEAQWVFVPLIDANGNLVKQYRRSRITDFVIATHKMDTPEKQEAFMKMVNLTAQIFSPDEKPTFIGDSNLFNTGKNGAGNFWHANIVVLQFPQDLDAEWRQQQMVAKDIEAGTGDPSKYNAYGKIIYRQMNDWKTKKFDYPDFAVDWSIYEIFKVGGSQHFNQENFEKLASWDAMWGPETDSMVKYGSEWSTKSQEYFITAVTTGQVEENYDKWVNYWMTNGGASALEEVNAWYQANKK